MSKTKPLRILLSAFLFGIIFLLLNGLVFFHNYVVLFVPEGIYDGPTVDVGSFISRVEMMFAKIDFYYFIFSLEMLLMLGAFFFVKKLKAWMIGLFSLASILLFIFNIYIEFYDKFYSTIPSIRNDLLLASESLPVFLNSLTDNASNTFFTTLILLLLVALVFVLLIRWMLKSFFVFKDFLVTRILYALLLVLGGYLAFGTSSKKAEKPLIHAAFLSPSILQTFTTAGADKYKESLNSPHKSFMQKKLKDKPNVYVIFLESYGGVATESDSLREGYRDKIKEIGARLAEGGYHAASQYSVAPIKGGRSWLSFMTLMSGLKVDNQIQHNDLISLHATYPHMVRFFNNQGYHTYRLSTMNSTKSDSLIPYRNLNLFWGFDEWWTYKDFGYKGPKYNYLGGMPDQYLLGYFRDSVAYDEPGPKFMSCITMVSHAPFHVTPPFLDDWRAFNQTKEGWPNLRGDHLYRYGQTMHYNLELLTRFVLEDKENSVFIFAGDHQPPALEFLVWDKMNDAATPVHIISKDSALIDRLVNNGFQQGMQLSLDSIKYLHHEEIYPRFIEALTAE